jgi:hypothetical protein
MQGVEHMSRLDDHVAAVQNKLALRQFIIALAWSSVIFISIVWLAVLLDRIFLLQLPKPAIWLYAGAGATLLASLIYAITQRPDANHAAIAIDQKLGLKEKISTALIIRRSDDSFAQAAVRDAEETARSLVMNLRQNFPLSFPKAAYVAIALAIAALLSYQFIDPMNLFDRQEKHNQQVAQQAKIEDAKKTVQNALATVEAMPKTAASEEAIRLAKTDLQAALNQPITDPNATKRTAVKALQDVTAAIKEQIKNSAQYADAQNEMKMMRSMQAPAPGGGPVSDAHRAIVKGEFTEAIDDLSKAVENFDKMDKSQQQQAAQQMKQLAQQLQQMANNPAQQQKMQQQLQQAGMNQKQAQQAQQLMQQAAQGDKQAQQQLQQMAQQAQQQMNNGQPPTPQQQQQMQQMMQQMQAQANSQQQAQQMQQAAQQMAQAMQQQAQQQQGQQGQPKRGQGQQQAQQQNQQQMAQGQAQMQQQLQQMQAMAQDAQQIAAAQNAAQAAQSSAEQAMGNNPGQGQKGGQPGGQWANNQNIQGGNNPGQWNQQAAPAGPNQGGQGAGDRTYKQAAPFSVKPEISPSQDDEKGRILASTYIKDNKPNKGTSTAELQDVAKSALNDSTDEIDQERISRQAQSAVKQYFGSMEKEQQ